MANFAGAFLLFALLLPSTINSSSLSRCPKDCICDLDVSGRYVTACIDANLKQIPINEMDKKMEIIIIQNPKTTLTIGHLFSDFRKLEILRITDANVPAIGMHSFWGVPTLKTLDLSRNNITQIYDDNFKGQQNLIELNLAGNKLERIPSGTFKYLTVSDIYCTPGSCFIDIS
jgi:Leucine-rich repeat (LRR) protein